ncbi:TetR/AcrR family transcriptional regulator [Enterococcus ureasiticus]|uniref:TetR family transcriptional regulator n=1 Tax=Enterococcus ureasiticus TaxID=903984 RepID=A0A1E5GN29_9ENTE|nr:TetR/AcrR family transcriptional regulator [Enterococcus ureasiticus]OEG14103.1 TetR family transcriptional regulator [Enterococcus ureasiticus]
MPKKTFFHLSEEKQQRLLEAASIEFSRTPLKEASIANIVKLAEIPRGSFYQYFEDKEDLYYYYFESLRQDSKKNIEKCIKEADGELFEGMTVYFSKMIFDVLIGEHAAFYQNLFMHMDDQVYSRVFPKFSTNSKKGEHWQKKCHGYKIYKAINFSNLTIHGEKEFKLLMQMLMNSVYSSIVEGYRQLEKNPQYDIEQIVENFKIKLNWLKNGVYQ